MGGRGGVLWITPSHVAQTFEQELVKQNCPRLEKKKKLAIYPPPDVYFLSRFSEILEKLPGFLYASAPGPKEERNIPEKIFVEVLISSFESKFLKLL